MCPPSPVEVKTAVLKRCPKHPARTTIKHKKSSWNWPTYPLMIQQVTPVKRQQQPESHWSGCHHYLILCQTNTHHIPNQQHTQQHQKQPLYRQPNPARFALLAGLPNWQKEYANWRYGISRWVTHHQMYSNDATHCWRHPQAPKCGANLSLPILWQSKTTQISVRKSGTKQCLLLTCDHVPYRLRIFSRSF